MDLPAFQATRGLEDDAAVGANPLRREHVKRAAAVAANPEFAGWRRLVAVWASQARVAWCGLDSSHQARLLQSTPTLKGGECNQHPKPRRQTADGEDHQR